MKKIMILACMAIFFIGVLCLEVPTSFAGLQDNGDGTVTDTVTGLMWQQGDGQNDGGGRTWEAALGYCQSLELGGHNDWRMPNVRELESLVDETRYNPSIGQVFECRPVPYWSSSTYTRLPEYAWDVHFQYGPVYWISKDDYHFVRCVRDVTLCAECAGDPVVLQNVTFQAGTDCECTATTSITIGSQVIIESGATVIFKAPTIKAQPGFRAKPGAVVKMRQQ